MGFLSCHVTLGGRLLCPLLNPWCNRIPSKTGDAQRFESNCFRCCCGMHSDWPLCPWSRPGLKEDRTARFGLQLLKSGLKVNFDFEVVGGQG